MDPHAAAILKPEKRKRSKGRARGADVPNYADPKQGWQGPVERIANPIQRSRIDLVWCDTCRAWMLEGSKANGWCRGCGARHPHHGA